MITLTNRQARLFMLLKHGLAGTHRFVGRQGVLDFVRQAGCIQFDPVDVCGKNPELVLQSRVKGFTKKTLYDLLYSERLLVDDFDKQLSIYPIDEWPYFRRYREPYRPDKYLTAQVEAACDEIKQTIRERGPVSSADLECSDTICWHWGADTKISRAALETMYFRGELVVHHKKGSIKYYDLAHTCLPADIYHAPDPLPDDFEHRKWRVLRRIGAVGLLWNKPSDAWLNIKGLVAAERGRIFERLCADGEILEVAVEGLPGSFYCRADAAGDEPLLQRVQENPRLKPRCELIAPLDNLLWDRKLIKSLFGFEYTWEIYTPAHKRRYGYYTLPLLYGDGFVGRVEAVADRKARRLVVKNIWFEVGVRQTKTVQAALDACLKRFAAFNECTTVICPGV